jgi:hypothetical protein
MPLEKHEIAKDRNLEHPLQMTRYPPNENASDLYTCKSEDNLRAHIMPSGISGRGSVMWDAIDVRKNNSRWIERRQISDRILELWGG